MLDNKNCILERIEATLPTSNKQWGVVRLPFRKIIYGKENVEKSIARWHPFNPVIVSTPGSNGFKSPISIQDYSDKLHRASIKKQEFIVSYLTLSSLILSMIYLLAGAGDVKIFKMSLICAIFSMYFYIDLMAVVRHIDKLRDRTLFIIGIFQKLPLDSILLCIFLSFFFIFQFFLERQYGGLTNVIYKFGLIFDIANQGEYWRYIIGPYLHSGIPHFLSNILSLLVALSIARPFCSLRIYLVFFASISFAPLIIEISPIVSEGDSYVGISGGVMAIYGWLTSFFIKNRREMPKMFWFTPLALTVLMFVLPMIMSDKASNLAHLSGLFIGLIAGLLMKNRFCEIK